MGYMVGDLGHEKRRAHTGHFCDLPRDALQAVLPFFGERVVIFAEEKFQRLDHSDNFFFADFLTAAERVLVRAVVEQGICDQIFVADEQSSALRAANRFTSTESDEVVTHVGVIPEMRDGGCIGGPIVYAKEGGLPRPLRPLVHLDPTSL